jgi:signal recognition particle subunit SRP68
MKATHLFESQQQWPLALQHFTRAKTIYERLAVGGGSAEQEALCHARLDEIEPSIRYCLYNIQLAAAAADGGGGGGSDIENISRMAETSVRNDSQLVKWFAVRLTRSFKYVV